MDRTIPWNDGSLLEELRRRSGTEPAACFQCHKCSTGCPAGPDMDFLPSQVVRLAQLGAREELLSSRAIWMCVSCEACTARCPMEVDVASVMDALRILAVDLRIALPDERASQFYRCFLNSVRRHGRVYEMGMMASYKLRMLDLFTDVGKVPKMLAQGKLSILPSRSGGVRRVREIFRRTEEKE